MGLKKHIVKISKVGTLIDNGIGDCYLEQWQQDLRIKRAKQEWKNTIQCPKILVYETKHDKNHIPEYWIDYHLEDNPYYGWKESQLKIVIE